MKGAKPPIRLGMIGWGGISVAHAKSLAELTLRSDAR